MKKGAKAFTKRLMVNCSKLVQTAVSFQRQPMMMKLFSFLFLTLARETTGGSNTYNPTAKNAEGRVGRRAHDCSSAMASSKGQRVSD